MESSRYIKNEPEDYFYIPEPKSVTTHKPGPQWTKPMTTESDGIHPSPGPFIRRVRSSPLVCSALGHDTSFRSGEKDECRTCGVEWN